MGRKLQPGVDKIDEAWVKKEIYLILKSFPLSYWIPGASQYGTNGQHDIIISQRGLLWSIEAKAGNAQPNTNQKVFAELLQKGGALCVLVNEWNIALVGTIAEYVHQEGALPYHLQYDFYNYRPAKKPK